jgi:hypothetical protein
VRPAARDQFRLSLASEMRRMRPEPLRGELSGQRVDQALITALTQGNLLDLSKGEHPEPGLFPVHFRSIDLSS